jgi:hypothetical protein
MKNIRLLCLTLGCTFAVAFDNGAELTKLQQRISLLESGIQRTEAVRAIKWLQYGYGHYLEMGMWNDAANLFSENGVGHFASDKLGKGEIRKYFLNDIGKGKPGLGEGRLYTNIMLQPVVTLAPDGKTAKGRWRLLSMQGSLGETAFWEGGIYENEYILERDVWKIKDLHYYPKYSGAYDKPGWSSYNEEVPIHYSPALAGTPIPAGANPPASVATPGSLTKLNSWLGNLSRRVQQLNDENEVDNLQCIYGYYVDRKMWDDVADLFADGATMELGLQGVYVGRNSIRRALDRFGLQGLREGELNDHLQLQPIIRVAPDGLTAKARGIELAMTGVNGERAQWSTAIFENEFIKQNGVWHIKSVHVYPRLITDYEKGWAKDAKPAPGPDKTFSADRPPTETFEIYPKFHHIPFHFPNPAMRITDTRAPGKASVPIMAELAGRVDAAERMLKTAAAYDSAENLASAYGYYLDESMWDETADLFARDAKRHLSTISTTIGRERLRQDLKNRYPGGKSKTFFTVHQLLQPVIHVEPDGLEATMRVRLFQLGGASGGNGFWLAGSYENRVGLEDGFWKFTAMDLEYTWTADYKSGWARVSDGAKGIVVTPFPKIMALPFHYKNPVSERTPPAYRPQI